MTAPTTPWPALVAQVTSGHLDELRALGVEAETRRRLATYDTGTVSLAAAVVLRALTLALAPKVAIEIGTFIGTSTTAMVAERIYTCDKDNACVQSSGRITAFTKTSSTRMFEALVKRGVQAQFFFLDGRLKPVDLPLVRHLAAPEAVFAFDDYELGPKGQKQKGMLNTDWLRPQLPGYVLIEPPADVLGLDSTTTIAVLAPEGLL
jgi:predicted O-methyltransferase YrrM